MFTGAVNSKIREWFGANHGLFAGRPIWVGCSGNFTIETVLSIAKTRPREIISSDVSIYTSVLGAYFTDGDFRLNVKPGYEWLQPYLAGTESMAAACVVLLEMSDFHRQQTRYHRRMWEHWKKQFAEAWRFAKGRLAIRKKSLHINRYFAEDMWTVIDRVPDDAVFLSFMPTYAAGYERLYRIFEAAMEWPDEPGYVMIDAARKELMLEKMTNTCRYVHIDNVARAKLGVRVMAMQAGSRPVFLHTNLPNVGSELYRSGERKRKAPSVALLGLETELADRYTISIITLTSPEFAWVRDQYLAKKIIPAEPSWKYGVCINEYLVGVLGWKRSQFGRGMYYLLCDMAVPSNRYRRLSKLVCAVARTRHMGDILRQTTGRLWTGFRTTAFTHKAVSMKYRGVLNLQKRDKKKGFINYVGTFDWSRKQVIKKWKKWEK